VVCAAASIHRRISCAGAAPARCITTLASGKHNEIRDGLHTKLGRERGLFFGIHLEDDRLARHVLRQRVDLRRDHLARSAPAAQKSTSTGTGDSATTSRNSSSSASSGSLTGGREDLHDPQRPWCAKCRAGTRFFALQTGQARSISLMLEQ
jgi:hypothetical protein